MPRPYHYTDISTAVPTRSKAELPKATLGVLWSVVRLCAWVGYFYAFYQGGLALTTWLLETTDALGTIDRVLACAFPLVVVTFPWVNRRFLRASRKCDGGMCGI